MSEIEVGVNMEFVRHDDLPFAAGVAKAAELGYAYVEPMVHNGRELLSEAGYFHSFSMDDEPLVMKDILEANGVKASGLSAHTPLMRPEIAVPYLQKAIRFAAAVGAPVVNTDEGIRPEWLSDDDLWPVMRYTLTQALRVAERYGIYLGIEPHQSISQTTGGLLRIHGLVDSPWVKINYDTGNAHLGGEDPYAGLEACADELIHIHAKDISYEQSGAQRGAVTGTPVGCACGDGVIDWARVIGVLGKAGFTGVLSVECGTIPQAARSLKHLNACLEGTE